MPTVSVIVPNYNHSAYLDERLDSIFNQTYSDFEVIILDDCSTDDSRSVIEKYRGHKKVSQLVFNDTNSGSTFRQWAKGITLAKGKYIWIAESDDWCEPTMLETLVEGMNGTCVLAYAQSLVVDQTGRVLWSTSADFLQVTSSGATFVAKSMLTRNAVVNASMAIFLKECFYKVDSDFMDFKFCGDWLFWIQVAVQGDIFISGKTLNYFRKHSKDVSGGAYQQGLYYSEYIRLIDILKAKGILDFDQYRILVKGKFVEFVKDHRVQRRQQMQIRRLFQEKLGLQAHLIAAKVRIDQIRKSARRFYHRLLL